MPLRDGQSALDQVVLRLPDEGIEIRNWTSYRFTQNFQIPTPAWSFTLPPSVAGGGYSSFDDPEPTGASGPGKELLTGIQTGARVEISLNDRLQCTGYIEKVTSEVTPNGGTLYTIEGRDILGPVVDACIDPAYKFTSGSTILDCILGVLAPFGIDTVYTTDDLNVSVITGLPKGASGTRQKVKVKIPKRVARADGTIELQYDTKDSTVVVDARRRDLRRITVKQIKPKMGEGVFAFLDRILRRFGLMIWAAADGSGVVVDAATFDTSTMIHRITHRNGLTDENNVLTGSVVRDVTGQPSLIVGFATGGGQAADKTRNKVIMVNELVAYEYDADLNLKPIDLVQDIKARYKGAKVIPPREEVIGLEFLGKHRPAPMFIKDDESYDMEQLESFIKRKMAELQQKSLVATYEVAGHTYRNCPWAVNTMVDVFDEVQDVMEPMWCVEKTFKKSRAGGTTTTIKLIRPKTFQIN
ncbi:hypothetical protein WMF27_20495 [Sorangium sp. So ce281]|uniref:phage baseplate assembly protein n=1 Tax=unclassified Sorangium TaxID=2621164 RepID=UPI003F61B471